MDVTVVKIEIAGSEIEVRYSDGSREEIEDGRYERKNPAGDTVEERPATGADRARLEALSVGDSVGGAGGAPSGDDDGTPDQGSGDAGGGPETDAPAIVKVEIAGDSIEISYSDGSREEIEAGRYERKNPAGDTVEERPATEADRARLEALSGTADPALVERAVLLADGTRIETGPAKIEVTYPDGTREEIEAGRYERKDAVGETVEERSATEADIARLTGLVPDGTELPDLGTGAPGGVDDDDGTPDQGPGDAPGTPGGDDDGRRIAEDVTLFYTETLGRAPDRAGLNFWVDRAEDGLDLDDLADAFIDSFEFADAVGDPDLLDNAGFVATLFDEVLERTGDTAGEAFWTAFLDSGGERTALVVAFVISDENREHTPELDALVEVEPGEWEIPG